MRKTEIERKFLVRMLPSLMGIKAEKQERYFLELGEIEKRVTRIDGKYIYEEKTKGDGLRVDKISREISKKEFERLRQVAIRSLIRKNYVLSEDISIKKYEGDYEGLIRAEFEFEDEEEARKFKPPRWAGEGWKINKVVESGVLGTIDVMYTCLYNVHMNNNVSVTKFRNDIFNYIEESTKKQKQIGVTKGKRVVGWFVPNSKTKETRRDKVDIFLEEIENLQKKYPIKGGKNLSRDIDKILYGKE